MNETSLAQFVFPDTNVLIHGRALHDLPWDEFDGGDIVVVICGPVIRELDRLKTRGGRAGRAARAMSATVRELMETVGHEDVLREKEPRVVRVLALGSAVREPVRPGLDLANDDQSIINQALARLDAGEDVTLLTNDNFAALIAAEYGLPVKLLPAHWLKEPEADEAAKEIARRDAEIARLKSTEPSLQARFVSAAGDPIDRLELTLKRHLPVAEADVVRLTRRAAEAAKLADVQPSVSAEAPPRAPGTPFDLADLEFLRGSFETVPVTKADIERYRVDHADWVKAVRGKLAGFHVEWNERRDRPAAQLRAVNSGTRPAADVLVELLATGNFRISGPGVPREERGGGNRMDWLSLDMPPDPPKVRRVSWGSPGNLERLLADDVIRGGAHLGPHLPMPNPRREDDKFYWRDGKVAPVRTMGLECRTWRHGRDEEDFRFRIWGSEGDAITGLIIGRLSASNLAQAVEARLPVRIQFVDTDTTRLAEQLVDDLERRLAAKNWT